jgi:hypothetical protein
MPPVYERAEDIEAVADVLEGAAEVLETEGWGQGKYVQQSDPVDGYRLVYCATGALRKAAKYDGNTNFPLMRAYSELRKGLPVALSNHGTMRPIPVETWNDQPERTASEVIDLMKHTAKDLRNRKAAA